MESSTGAYRNYRIDTESDSITLHHFRGEQRKKHNTHSDGKSHDKDARYVAFTVCFALVENTFFGEIILEFIMDTAPNDMLRAQSMNAR